MSIGCGPQENIKCVINDHGLCRLDTANFIDMEAEASHCGFIRVNDRYLIQKYGVPYKEFQCRSCESFEGNTHGTCITKKENCYCGAHACGEFKKKEDDNLKTFYTKCGIEFKKSSTATVTGYTIDAENIKCSECSFKVEVFKGWPQVHDRWECRAGSQPPNHKNEWRGSLEDKNTISIWSLDNEFMESIRAFCIAHPELGAAYNQDLDDCRRSLSISCSANKKGMAAKKELVDKFFGRTKGETSDMENTCANCEYSVDYGESVLYIKCNENGKEKDVKKTDSCHNYMPVQDAENFEPMGDLEDQLEELLGEGDKDMKENACPYEKLSCDCRCIDLDKGCDVIRRKDWDRYHYVKEMQKYNIDCDIFKSLSEEIIAEKKPEKKADTTIEVPVSSEVQSFDYSCVDIDTASFLQEKEAKITQIRMMSVLAIGKELKEVHEKLANHYQGTFGKWCKNIGITDQTAMNYIKAHEYVAKNFGNIEDAESIQTSLLFAISKPSAPAELQKAVVEGDITTHKQYKELEAQLRAKEAEAEEANGKAEFEKNACQRISDSYNRLEKTNHEHYERAERLRKELEEAKKNNSTPEDISLLKEQLEEALRQVEILTDELMKPVDIEPAVVEKEVEVERAADKDYEYVSDFLGKFITVHTGQIKNWAKVLGTNVTKQELERTKQNLIALNRNMLDAIEDEIANKE